MDKKQQKLTKDLQVASQINTNNQQFMCRKIQILLPRNFINDNHIDDCLVYKTNFCHMAYRENTLLNVSGEFLLLYTANNKKRGKIKFPFTESFLCDFFPYYIKIPSPAEIDFSGQEIEIRQTIIVSDRNIP